jgi:hypothetical protein
LSSSWAIDGMVRSKPSSRIKNRFISFDFIIIFPKLDAFQE